MAITYSLKITQMDVLPKAEGETDVVVCAHWAYSGTTDDGRSAACGGSTKLTYTAGSSFVPYNELTEADVVAWVLGTWTPEEQAAYQSLVDGQLVVQTMPLPWTPPPVVEDEPVADPVEAQVVDVSASPPADDTPNP